MYLDDENSLVEFINNNKHIYRDNIHAIHIIYSMSIQKYEYEYKFARHEHIEMYAYIINNSL